MEYDKNRYNAIKWTNWEIINWILNPGIATNELILGQRIPKLLLIENEIDDYKSVVRFAPCLQCGNIHSEKTMVTK